MKARAAHIFTLIFGLSQISGNAVLADASRFGDWGDWFSEVCLATAPGFVEANQVAADLGFEPGINGLPTRERSILISGPPHLILGSDQEYVGRGFDTVEVDPNGCVCTLISLVGDTAELISDVSSAAREDWFAHMLTKTTVSGRTNLKFNFDGSDVDVVFEPRDIAGSKSVMVHALSSRACEL